MIFRAELHVHTVLSPCADVEMIPPFIVQTAVQSGITLIGITDHNSTANISAVLKAAKGSGVHVLPGMELQTQEEVHLLCLFDHLDQAREMQIHVDKHLPEIANDPEYFGEQFVVDETGEFIRRENRLLLNSAQIPLEKAVSLVHQFQGIAIPAHINRRAFGLIEMLGFIPPNIPFDAVEISNHVEPKAYLAAQRIPITLPVIQSGDVHRLEEFGGKMMFDMHSPSISEISLALNGLNGRSFHINSLN